MHKSSSSVLVQSLFSNCTLIASQCLLLHLFGKQVASFILMQLCGYSVCMYVLQLSKQKPGCLFPINDFNPAFIQPLSAFYIGAYLLQSAEPLCLFGPKHLYEPCFCMDKYDNYIYIVDMQLCMYIQGLIQGWMGFIHLEQSLPVLNLQLQCKWPAHSAFTAS